MSDPRCAVSSKAPASQCFMLCYATRADICILPLAICFNKKMNRLGLAFGNAAQQCSQARKADRVPTAIASTVVLMILLYGSFAVKLTPDVWQCVRSKRDFGFFGEKCSSTSSAHSWRAARSLATSIMKFIPIAKKNDSLQHCSAGLYKCTCVDQRNDGMSPWEYVPRGNVVYAEPRLLRSPDVSGSRCEYASTSE